ncbi:ankyrin repeat domain-containing protein [Legionella sp. CNM-1927-20]|uniref:ankyrin repeat domain-containing protein n=1 Tax=Legionella sp. CNM-1927-20 TaxID=3422221 RepID=UPI00403B0CC8
MPSIHRILIELQEALGYSPEYQGLCHGFSLRWLEAALLGNKELQRFENRINKIVSIPVNALAQAIKQAKAQKGGLSLEEQKLLDIQVFIDSLKLFHAPNKYSDLFNKTYVSQQQIELVSRFASSDAIKELGGLKEIYSAPFISTKEEMKNYLDYLGELFEKQAANISSEPIGILLGTLEHTVAMVYKPGQGFIYRDSNQDPLGLISDNTLLVDAIMQGQGFQNDSPYSAFNVKVIIPAEDKRYDHLKTELASFKKLHPINKEIAQREANSVNLVHIAAHHGHHELIYPLKILGADLNKRDKNGRTPAFMGAQEGHYKVISLLGLCGADFNIADEKGVTPAIISAQNGHDQVITQLGLWGADLDITDNNGTTAAYMAAQNGHERVITQLEIWGADFNIVDEEGTSPIFIATQNKHDKVIKQLYLAGADLDIVADNIPTVAYVAACYGNVELVKKLLKWEADFSIPFMTTKGDLIKFAKLHGVHVEQRMADFLLDHTTEEIEIIPYEIAYIMGYDDILKLLDNHLNLEDNSLIEQQKGSTSNLEQEDNFVSKKKRLYVDEKKENLLFFNGINELKTSAEKKRKTNPGSDLIIKY